MLHGRGEINPSLVVYCGFLEVNLVLVLVYFVLLLIMKKDRSTNPRNLLCSAQ